jgi:FkbM family methyltransferase
MKWNASLAGSFEEIFVEQPYSWLAKKIRPNTTVIDIGANIGDTAIYFAMIPNVKKVFAYEPNPETFSWAKNLINKSPTRKKITLINKAISSNGGIIRVGKVYAGDKMFSYENATQMEDGIEMESITLKKALKGLRNVVIKSDAEGGEKEIFNKVNLSNVYALIVEYHNCKSEVIEALRKDFYLKTKPTASRLGYIYAIRRKNKRPNVYSNRKRGGK